MLGSLKICDENLTTETWNNFTKNYSRFCAALQITAVLGRYGLEELRKRLTGLGYKDEEIPKIISLITYPKEHTPLFKSQMDLIKIGAEIQSSGLNPKDKDINLKKWLSHQEKNKKAKELIEKINDDRVRILAETLAEATSLNEFRKGIFSKVSLEYRGIFSEVAKMAGSKKQIWQKCNPKKTLQRIKLLF